MLVIASLFFANQALQAQPPASRENANPETPSPTAITAQPGEPERKIEKQESESLKFSFEGAPWRDVIDWLASESNLALHVSDLPTGSLTYSDPNTFTHQEAIDRVNLFLLPQGFTLVRSGRLLSVINLGDRRSMQQLDALAKLVSLDELAKLPAHDVVKCFFPLPEIAPEDAVQELEPLNLMTTPAVFEKTKQLLITDTASKLRNVKTVLDAFKPSTLDNGTVMKSFSLDHVEAEDILVVARPHLGLATGEMIGIDVSLSADVQGKNIFVTGVEDKVKLIEGLVKSIDVPQKSLTTEAGKMELKSYAIQGGNVETVYNVLQTLLSGKEVRLSMDETGGAIVALASPATQVEIAQTVTQLQSAQAEFEVIPLKNIDPYFAISLLEEMLDLPTPFDDPEEVDADAPKIDADPGNMRLFVRGKRHQIDQIQKIIAGLDVKSGASESGQVRIYPLRGKQAELVLETAGKFWRGENPIIMYRSTDNSTPEQNERVANGQTKVSTPVENPQPASLNGRLLGGNPLSKSAAIRCQLTSRGILLQSEDTEALNRFVDHLRAVSGPVAALPSPPIVFYLKYTKPQDVIRLLAQLLDGGETAKEGEAGSLVNGYVAGASSNSLGSLVTSRDGAMTLISGSITVVADSRLNRLIAQGTASDIDRIESYLKIIDKDTSITDIETYGRSRVIELKYTKAVDVAASLREAYAGRIATAAGGSGAATGSPAQRAAAAAAKSQAETAKTSKDGKKADTKKTTASKTGNAPAPDLEPKMTVAVHEPSNSLIVTAPEQLYREVEQLVKLIDSRGKRTVEVLGPINANSIESMLQQVLSSGGAIRSSRSSASPTRSPSSSSSLKSRTR